MHELAPRLKQMTARRIILTHMNPDMLAERHRLPVECAEDGLTITL